MKAKRLLNLLVPAVAVTMGVSSCQDFDAGFNEKSIQYTDEFKEAFGDIDPNQDWSLATQITAHVSGMEDGMMEIYYSDPIGGQPVILTKRQIINGEAEFKFDVVKGTKKIFARINDGKGYYSLKSYFNIVDGVVNIAPTLTRAEVPTGVSRVVKGDAYSISSPQVLKISNTNITFSPTAAGYEDVYIDGSYIDPNDHGKLLIKNSGTEYWETGTFSNFYNLYNVLSAEDERPEWFVKDIAHFFDDIDGEKAAFKEGENHVKLMKDGATPHLNKDLVFEMEEAGPFYLDYFFKGTKYNNQFGYFYYTGDVPPTRDQFMTMPKFILVDNMSNREAKINVGYAQGAQTTWNLLNAKSPCIENTAGLGAFDGIFTQPTSPTSESNYDTKIVGTRFQLTYFGADGTDTEGSYTFPQNTKIGLFFIGNVDDGRVNEVITSISALNLQLFNESPHAASFQYNDQVVFAMEDMRWGGDADVNDAMFIANGKFKKTDIPNIKPVEPTAPTWVMACEDLGGTFDYDFNDLVFGLRMTPIDGENSKLELVPLAAGGTLKAEIYYGETKVGEIHNLVRSGAPTSVPLNVNPRTTAVAGTPVTLATSISSSTSVNDIAARIKIVVTKDEETSTNNKDEVNQYNIGYHWKQDGYEAPQVLLLSPGWEWPSENTFICDIYEDFAKWVGDTGVQGSWVANKKGTMLVHNPLPAVVTPPSGDSGEGGGSGSETPETPVAGDNWNITVNGNASMIKGATQTLTITVDGLSDYSNVTVGAYSNTVIEVGAFNTSNHTVTVTGKALGEAMFYVRVPADDTHTLTRKDFAIKVTKKIPSFTLSTSAVGLEVNGTAQFTMSTNDDIVNTDGWTCVSDNEAVATISNFNKTYSPATITAHSTGTATITVTFPGNGDWESVSRTISVKVGTPVEGNPIDITSRMGTLQKVQKEWINENAALVDMSSFNWTGMTGAKLRITGSANGQVSVSVYEGNDYVIARNSFSNGVIEGSILKLIGKDKFYIVDHAGGLTITKLEIIPITIK